MRLDELRGRRVVLLGLGEDVRAALPSILAAGPADLVLVDSGTAHSPGSPGSAGSGSAVAGRADLRVVELEDAAATAEVFVRSPGFPRYLPALVEARQRGALMTTPVDLWMGSRAPGQRVVAITGTKGKSTTTDLVGHFAREAGLRVGLAGNLGVPVFAEGWDSSAPIVVLEVSSYQAADLHHLADIAVLTSLSEDHLDWHGGIERYHSDKLRVLHQGAAVAPVVIVSADSSGAMHAAEDFTPVVVVPPESGPALPQQRVQNAALAAEVIRQLGGPSMSAEQILAAAARSMPGRLDLCPTVAGGRFAAVQFVDDALASNPSATAAALTWARQQERTTVVILGGADRGVTAGPLLDEAALWAPGMLRVVALPENGHDMAMRAGLEVAGAAEDVGRAVPLAASLLSTAGSPGIVLFSPAAPTPSGSGNWADRSAAFRRAIAELA